MSRLLSFTRWVCRTDWPKPEGAGPVRLEKEGPVEVDALDGPAEVTLLTIPVETAPPSTNIAAIAATAMTTITTPSVNDLAKPLCKMD